MYAVIFRAEVAVLDDRYSEMAAQLRDLALRDYGCREFTAVTEGNSEVAISYWDSEEQILAWKQDPLHREAQRLGSERWYTSWSVEVVEIRRAYHRGAD